jgi:hypothetical protein
LCQNGDISENSEVDGETIGMLLLAKNSLVKMKCEMVHRFDATAALVGDEW